MSIFKSEKLEKTLGLVLDILFAIVLLAVVLLCAASLSTRRNFLGIRLGVIRSPSMEASDLYVGDVVWIHREDRYGVGDVIAFYRAPSEYGEAYDGDVVNAETAQIWIHEIVEVRTDGLGRACYLTKGTSNEVHDGFYVPQDFVLGVGVPMPSAIGKIIGFATSLRGVVSLIIVPSSIMIIYLVWELIMILTMPKEREEEQKTSSPTRYRKTFMARLSLASEELKARYNAVKNEFLSYFGVKCRLSRSAETYYTGRNALARLNVRGKKLYLRFCLTGEEIPERKYYITDRSERGKDGRKFPSEFKVQSERGVRFAFELIARAAEKFGLRKRASYEPADYAPPRYETTELLKLGYLREFTARERIAFDAVRERGSDAEVISEELDGVSAIVSAEACATSDTECPRSETEDGVVQTETVVASAADEAIRAEAFSEVGTSDEE